MKNVGKRLFMKNSGESTITLNELKNEEKKYIVIRDGWVVMKKFDSLDTATSFFDRIPEHFNWNRDPL